MSIGRIEKLRVHFVTGIKNAVGAYRMGLPFRALVNAGWDVSYSKTIDLRDIPHDVVVYQVPIDSLMPKIIEETRKKAAVVVEVDDNYTEIQKMSSARAKMDHLNLLPDTIKECAELADLVTCTTPALAQIYGAHSRCHILPNCVPEEFLHIGNRIEGGGRLASDHKRHPLIGWAGRVSGHPGDLNVLDDSMNLFLEKYPEWNFHCVGDATARRKLDLPKDRFSSVGWQEFGYDYLDNVSALDIGLVPLDLNRFNESKSYIKGLEYAALGVPFIASPTSAYQSLYEIGIGELAETPDDFLGIASEWAEEYPTEKIAEWKETASELTIEKNIHKWMEAYHFAVHYREA